MNIHEFQAKTLLAEYGVSSPQFEMVEAKAGIEAALDKILAPYVVKAQIHSGGRGKAGGVLLCKDREAAKKAAEAVFGKVLVTAQTGPAGRTVKKIMITSVCEIVHEYYLGITVDRDSGEVVFIASSEGGVSIETTAAEHPERIVKVRVNIDSGLRDYHVRFIADSLGIGFAELRAVCVGAYELFIQKDCSLLEINPLAQVSTGLTALDAKIVFDDNALFKHPELSDFYDESEEDPRETEAFKYGLNYVALSGNIGCVVNGAGLAMATMDIIDSCGAKAANFLDVGGSASKEKITNAFKILLSDSSVRVILINIFGGIMQCDVFARGIVEAVSEIKPPVPIVIRLDGTNAKLAKKIILDAGLDLIPAATMREAAELCAQISGGVN